MSAWRWAFVAGWLALLALVAPPASAWQTHSLACARIAALDEPDAVDTTSTEGQVAMSSGVAVDAAFPPPLLTIERVKRLCSTPVVDEEATRSASWRRVTLRLERARGPPPAVKS